MATQASAHGKCCERQIGSYNKFTFLINKDAGYNCSNLYTKDSSGNWQGTFPTTALWNFWLLGSCTYRLWHLVAQVSQADFKAHEHHAMEPRDLVAWSKIWLMLAVSFLEAFGNTASTTRPSSSSDLRPLGQIQLPISYTPLRRSSLQSPCLILCLYC